MALRIRLRSMLHGKYLGEFDLVPLYLRAMWNDFMLLRVFLEQNSTLIDIGSLVYSSGPSFENCTAWRLFWKSVASTPPEDGYAHKVFTMVKCDIGAAKVWRPRIIMSCLAADEVLPSRVSEG